MATSGTSSFNYTAMQIISRSARQIGAIASGEVPDGQMYADFLGGLNAMVKEWDAMGIHLWTESEAILWLQPGQIQYALGPSSADHATQVYNQTALAVSAAAGANFIQVASRTGIAPGVIIGIVLDNGSIFWTSVLAGSFDQSFDSSFDTGNIQSPPPITTPGSFDPSYDQSFNSGTSTAVVLPGFTVALTVPLGGQASAGNLVFSYTVPLLRPTRVVNCRRFNLPSGIETPMNPMMSRFDYRELPNKRNTGVITRAFYDPQLVNGSLWCWPAPSDWTNAINFTWYRQIQDFNQPSDTPDLPQEWMAALAFNLAEEMMLEFDVPPARAQLISAKAAKAMDRVTGFDREPESVYFGVAFDQMGT